MGSGSWITLWLAGNKAPLSGGRGCADQTWHTLAIQLLSLSLVVRRGGTLMAGIISQVFEKFGGSSDDED